MKSKYLILGVLLLLLGLALAACTSAPTAAPSTPCPTAPPCPTCPTAPTPPPCPTPVVQVVPYQDAWVGSPHADTKAEAFNHWNDADPKEIPTSCAKCHSTPGFQDYVGADGSPAGVVDKAAQIGTVITCEACHNSATATLTSVIFPSGAVVENLGPEARCMTCHQGVASKVQVDKALTDAGLDKDLDKVDEKLGFINVHYRAAGATQYGTVAKGGYEYDGQAYDPKFAHVAGYDTCLGCHDQHTTELKIDQCATCHQGVATKDDLQKIRMKGSAKDYNGNGDTTEGIAAEVDGLRAMLLTALQSYAKEVAGTAIAYNADAYPYFFTDTNGDGQADENEAKSENAYKSFTGRLLKAAYNYQYSVKDPGAFAHNGKYVIELLYDSIADLNTVISTPVDLSKAARNDAGHFNASAEPFRHWDEEGEVPASCVRCHSGYGLPMYLKNGSVIAAAPTSGLLCSTCHDDLTKFTRYKVDSATFPSGAKISFGEGEDANLCIQCHQGRQSTSGVDSAIKASGAKDDQVSDQLSFRNPHYFAAGATLFGDEAKGAYEYAGQKYLGPHAHVAQGITCIKCHDTHGLNVNTQFCSSCHPVVKTQEDLAKIRVSTVDYNGNGDTTEGMEAEVATFAEKLLPAIQAYATKQGKPIAYTPAANPYYFNDTNGNGQADPEEVNSDNAYASWTPRLLRAAYNYQWYQKDPGAFAHNGKYMIQVLYDSLKDIGGDVQGMTRPEVTQ
jgi:Cytochrome c7 and related cytochrome c